MSGDMKDQKSNEHVTLKVTGEHDQTLVSFKIKRKTKLSKLMDAYREKQGLSGHVRFRYDGEAINPDDTPETLNMEDEDQLEAYQEQTGGRG